MKRITVLGPQGWHLIAWAFGPLTLCECRLITGDGNPARRCCWCGGTGLVRP